LPLVDGAGDTNPIVPVCLTVPEQLHPPPAADGQSSLEKPRPLARRLAAPSQLGGRRNHQARGRQRDLLVARRDRVIRIGSVGVGGPRSGHLEGPGDRPGRATRTTNDRSSHPSHSDTTTSRSRFRPRRHHRADRALLQHGSVPRRSLSAKHGHEGTGLRIAGLESHRVARGSLEHTGNKCPGYGGIGCTDGVWSIALEHAVFEIRRDPTGRCQLPPSETAWSCPSRGPPSSCCRLSELVVSALP
jgi:hypothetical protein